MYSYLKGQITEIEPEKITIDVHGVGYHVVVPNPFDFSEGEDRKLYIYQHVREDAHTLFGFATLQEKRLFDQLLSVKGIGPKSALAVIAAADVSEVVKAIETGDTKYLGRFPGIGPKASHQMVLDLRGKIEVDTLNVQAKRNLDEVEDALRALGYKTREIERAIEDLDPNADTAGLIKQALRRMAPKT